jgi:hypothetical protein
VRQSRSRSTVRHKSSIRKTSNSPVTPAKARRNRKSALNCEMAPNGAHSSALEEISQVQLADGTILEVVETHAGHYQLLVSKTDTDEIVEDYRFRGTVYRATRSSAINSIIWPSRLGELECLASLFEKIRRVLLDYLELPVEQEYLAAHFILHSWIPELFDHAFGLICLGDPSAQARSLSFLLAALCRRSLCISEINPKSFCDLPFHLQPTLVGLQPSFDLRTQHSLGGSCYRHFSVSRRGKLLRPYCVKALLTQDPIIDPRLLDTAVEISLLPSDRNVSSERMRELATEFQPRLLKFRLDTLRRARSELSLEINPLWIYGDCAELRAKMADLLKRNDQRSKVESSLAALIIEALLFRCHEGVLVKIHVAEINEVIRGILDMRHDSRTFSDKKIGLELNRLGLATETLGSGGRGLKLISSTCDRVHKLAGLYRPPTLFNPENPCERCATLRQELALQSERVNVVNVNGGAYEKEV